jgi:hypothetical protein
LADGGVEWWYGKDRIVFIVIFRLTIARLTISKLDDVVNLVFTAPAIEIGLLGALELLMMSSVSSGLPPAIGMGFSAAPDLITSLISSSLLSASGIGAEPCQQLLKKTASESQLERRCRGG